MAANTTPPMLAGGRPAPVVTGVRAELRPRPERLPHKVVRIGPILPQDSARLARVRALGPAGSRGVLVKPSHRRVAAATAVLLAAGVLPALVVSTSSAAPGAEDGSGPFSRIAEPSLTGSKVRVTPKRYAAVKVDLSQLRGELRTAPGARTARTGLTLRVPTPTGDSERFAVHRTQVMQAKLAAAHPEIADVRRACRSTTAARPSPSTSRRWASTPRCVGPTARAPGSSTRRTTSAAPPRTSSTTARSLPKPSELRRSNASCPRSSAAIERPAAGGRRGRARHGGRSGVYRLALLSDPSYADYFGTENVLAEKVTLMNRVNQVYNDDLADPAACSSTGPTSSTSTPTRRRPAPNGPCGAHSCYDLGPRPSDYVEGQLSYCDVGHPAAATSIVLGQLDRRVQLRHRPHRASAPTAAASPASASSAAIEKALGCTGLPEPQR